ncbi:MAG: amidohydrolase family protein [Myxococcota bacterium]|nr:amidohydrolase family protein [Myxococcota bacterium]
MNLWKLGVLALVACFQTACATSTPPSHSTNEDITVMYGGIIHTFDDRKPTVEAIKIVNGRIAERGTNAQILAKTPKKQARLVNLKGASVVPGLTDAHMHLFGLGKASFYLNLMGTESVTEIQAKVAQATKSRPKGEWILGRGWDQNDWRTGGEFPSAQDLDAVSPDHPVVLTRVDGHAIWVNSKALEAAAVNEQTQDVEGGTILRNAKKPTGVFVDNAMPLVRKHIPSMTAAQQKEAVLLAQQKCLQSGLTAVHDMGIGPEQLDILSELEKSGQLKLRVYAMLNGSLDNLEPLMKERRRIPANHRELLTIRGVKFFVDGALGSRGAALFEPYSDSPQEKGLILTPVDDLEKKVRLTKKHGFQPAIHAIGDRGNHEVINIYERVFGKEGTTHRPRLEHAQVLKLDDIPRLGKLGIIASMQPTHATSDMPWAEKRLGPDRIKGAYAWRSLMTSNATIAAGSDAPVESIEPLLGLYASVTRQDVHGKPEAGWFSEQNMTMTEAFTAFGKNAAWASFREHELGVIKEGYIADLTVLDKNIESVDGSHLLQAKILMTVVSGEIVYQASNTN